MTDDVIADEISERAGSLCMSYVVIANCEKLETDDPTFHLWTVPGQDRVMTMGLLATATTLESNNIVTDFVQDGADD